MSTLSNSGEVIAEEMIPASSIVAPMNPEVSSEYPCGEKYWDVRIEKVFTLRRISLRYVNSKKKGSTYAPAWIPNTRTMIPKSSFSRVDIQPYSVLSLGSPTSSFKRARCDLSWVAAYATEQSVHRKMRCLYWPILGGVGGRFQMRKTAGAATVSMIPRAKIYVYGVRILGRSWVDRRVSQLALTRLSEGKSPVPKRYRSDS